MWNNCPTAAGFLEFIRSVMGIATQYLPDDSPWIGYALTVSLDIVNPAFRRAPPPIYTLMVYNLGGDFLVNWTPDVPTNPPTEVEEDVNGESIGYFASLRKKFSLNGFVPGVITASSDQGTAESLQPIEALKTLTIAQLQNLKTPWGQAYLGWAQSFGTSWGLT